MTPLTREQVERLAKRIGEAYPLIRYDMDCWSATDAALRREVEQTQGKLWEALGALGYPVPGETPNPRYKCGLCEAKEQQLAEAQATALDAQNWRNEAERRVKAVHEDLRASRAMLVYLGFVFGLVLGPVVLVVVIGSLIVFRIEKGKKVFDMNT